MLLHFPKAHESEYAFLTLCPFLSLSVVGTQLRACMRASTPTTVYVPVQAPPTSTRLALFCVYACQTTTKRDMQQLKKMIVSQQLVHRQEHSHANFSHLPRKQATHCYLNLPCGSASQIRGTWPIWRALHALEGNVGDV